MASVPTVFPPAVLDVWVPCSTWSVGSGPLHNPLGSVLEQSKALSSLSGSVRAVTASRIVGKGGMSWIDARVEHGNDDAFTLCTKPPGTAVPSQI